jgi:hypothetical protein
MPIWKKKPREFERELRRFASSKTCIKATDNINKKGREASYMVSWWSRCVGICTDGAKAMTGRHSGVVTRAQAVAPNATCAHCSIHQEALDAKGMPDSLKDVLETTVKMIHFVTARPLNSRVFSALCNDMGSDHATLLQHTEVRWLSRGKVLIRFF